MRDFNSPSILLPHQASTCWMTGGLRRPMAKTFVAIWGMECKEQQQTTTFHLPKCMWNYRKKILLYAGLANYLTTVKISNPLSKIKTKKYINF